MKVIGFATFFSLFLCSCTASGDLRVTAYRSVSGAEAAPWPSGCLVTVESRTQKITGLYGLPCAHINIGDKAVFNHVGDDVFWVSDIGYTVRSAIDGQKSHDLAIWSFILALAALVLVIPLGIAANLLTPKVRLWWFLRSVKGTASKLISLVDYREELEKEPLFNPIEEIIFKQQIKMLVAVHVLAYLVVLAVVFMTKVEPHLPYLEIFRRIGHSVIPFVFIIFISFAYFVGSALLLLERSSAKARKKLESEIERLIGGLRAKAPPS